MKQISQNNKAQSIREAVVQARQRLGALSESASLDAQVLLANILERDRAWLLAHPETPLNVEQFHAFEKGVTRLEEGEPLPYVLGEWEFSGLPFYVTADVLIPRPETELLVDSALDWLKTHPESRRAVDVGTGSGCIAVTLAANVPDFHILATDISSKALAVARSNVERHNLAGHVTLQQGDLLSGIEGTFDLICANLPYIPTQMLKTLDVYRREPTLALDGGMEGLDLITRLLETAPKVLAPEGMILLEIEASQGESAATVAQKVFPDASIEVHADLNGHARLLRIQS